MGQQGVDHGVADEEDPLLRHPRPAQVGVSKLAGGEEPVGDAVGDHAVDLLRHGPVAGADAAFHMGHRDAQLLGGDGAGHGRGHVAHHQAQARRGVQQQAFVAGHDGCRLLGLGTGAHLQVHVRLRDAELLEKGPRQAGVIVLAGMHEAVAQRHARLHPHLQGADEGGDLHKVGASAGDDINPNFHI